MIKSFSSISSLNAVTNQVNSFVKRYNGQIKPIQFEYFTSTKHLQIVQVEPFTI